MPLRLERHVRNLVDVERTAMRFFERADLARPAGAVLGAEQLFLDAVRRHGGGVEDDERPVGAMRFLVQQARGKLLACPRGAAGSGCGCSSAPSGRWRLCELVDGG